MNLDELRQAIDSVDLDIQRLIEKRAGAGPAGGPGQESRLRWATRSILST